ncbi:2-dehydro-3-deoxygalactonokinase [Neolewinella litorea]|nr:2-dehydro-3-deoxygalactonokinase [Neolewinella litorea]
MPTAPQYFISCDWGTTNFRLRTVETTTGRVTHQQATTEGIRRTNQRFLAAGVGDRFAFFAQYLTEQLDHLPADYQDALVVASGMSSSNIGMYELPYAELPLDADGTRLIHQRLKLQGDRSLLLISGLRSTDSIMRGEEVQALGLMDRLQPFGDGTLILPGTHSKHLRYENGLFTSFSTYMTGELFELLASTSILAGSVAVAPFNPSVEAAFHAGVDRAQSGSLGRHLFTVRVRQVLEDRDPADNYFYLSGLLIGEELREAAAGHGMVYLAAPDPVYSLYRTALMRLLSPDRVRCFDGAALESALLSGQTKLLLQHVG